MTETVSTGHTHNDEMCNLYLMFYSEQPLNLRCSDGESGQDGVRRCARRAAHTSGACFWLAADSTLRGGRAHFSEEEFPTKMNLKAHQAAHCLPATSKTCGLSLGIGVNRTRRAHLFHQPVHFGLVADLEDPGPATSIDRRDGFYAE